MILKYGSYAHGVGEATIVISRTALFDERRRHFADRERWEIAGFLQAANQSQLTQAINALRAAYQISNQNLGLYLGDGVTRSSHFLDAENVLGQVRVIAGPSFPQGRGAEYSTFRSYQIVVEADIPIAGESNPDEALVAWEETLTFTGGGPRFVYLQTLFGLPQKQFVAAATPYRVTQQGRAAARTAYPATASPIWPLAEHLDQRQVARRGPHFAGGENEVAVYEVRWQYQFESDAPLVGDPTTR